MGRRRFAVSTPPGPRRSPNLIMTKLLAVAFMAVALTACTSTTRSPTAGNPAETKNSTDANKAGNPAAVSPGTGTSTGSGTGTGSTSR